MASMSLQSAYDQARQWLESNDLDRAIGLAQHILEQYPDNLEAYRILGEAYLANRQLDRAQESFERVLRSDPENIPAHVGLGITYERQSKLERAMPEFEQALEIKPDMAELRSQLLRLYADAWGSENAQLRLSRAGLARLYAKGHMLPQAIAEFRQVIADQPGRFDAMVALAEALWRDGQEEEAIALCRDILAKRPESLKANLIRGYLEMASGRPEGERYWEAARRMDPYQVVAKALFDTLPPDTAGEPMIEEWDEAAWRRSRVEEQQEHMTATRPMEAVTPSAIPAVESFRGTSWRDQHPSGPGASPAAGADDTDDFLAGLLALNTPISPPRSTSTPTPAPTPSASADDDLDLRAFSLDDTEGQQHASEKPTEATPVAPTSEEEPLMTPFSLADLGLTEDEIAGLDSLDSVSPPAAQAQRAPQQPSNEEIDMQPFSLADLGLTEDEIAGLDSLGMDTAEQPQPPAAPSRPAPAREMPSSADEERFDSEDLSLDLQPFSLDELDLGTGDESGKNVAGLPPALQPFSLDETPPRPRVSGFAAEESFENVADEEDIIPETGGYSWQQPTQRPETGFLRRGTPEPSSEDVSIFAKLKQRRQQEPEVENQSQDEEPLSSASLDEEAHLGLFSLDDISLRDEQELQTSAASAAPAPEEPTQPPTEPVRQPPAPERPPTQEVENLQDAIAAGQVQPFSLADLGLSPEEIAALGLSDAGPSTAPETVESMSDRLEEVQAASEPPATTEDTADYDHISPASAATTSEQEAPESADEEDEQPLLISDLKPFSLTDLGLSEEEIAALGLGAAGEAEEDVSSELGITEEELAGLDLVDPNWGAPPAPPSTPPPAEPTLPEMVEQHNLSGDLVVDRLIALGRQQGYVDISDIIAGVEDPEAEAERIEEIGRLLHEAHVEIRDGDEIIDMDAEYEEEDLAAAPESERPASVAPVAEEPPLTPFSLSELGLTDEEIAALGLGGEEPPIALAPETPALAAQEAEPQAEQAPPAAQEAEPSMTPFSLSELGLTDEEIARLETAPPGAEPVEAAEETSLPVSEVAEVPREEPSVSPMPEPAQPEAVAEEARRVPIQAPPPPAPPVDVPAIPAGRPEPPAPVSAGNEMLEGFLHQIEADPQNYALRLSVARIGAQIGMAELALQQYRQLIKQNMLLDQIMDDINDMISDTNDRQLLQRLHRLRGDVYSKQGLFREAIDEYSWTLSGSQNVR